MAEPPVPVRTKQPLWFHRNPCYSSYGADVANVDVKERVGYPHRLVYYAFDEPNSPDRIKRAADGFGKVKELSGGAFDTLTFIKPEYARKLGRLLDTPVLSTFFQKRADVIRELLDSGCRDVFYYWQCREEYPVKNRLLYGFYLWKSGATGAYANKFQAAGYADAFNDRSATLNWEKEYLKNSFVAYPAADGVIDTIQWEACREGVDDARYMSTLEALLERAAAAEATGELGAARRRAEEVVAGILGRMKKNYQASVGEIAPMELQDFRRRIAQCCVELTGLLASPEGGAAAD